MERGTLEGSIGLTVNGLQANIDNSFENVYTKEQVNDINTLTNYSTTSQIDSKFANFLLPAK